MSFTAPVQAEPDDDLPPPYSPGPNASAHSQQWELAQDHTADSTRTFDTIQQHIVNSKHTHELRWESEAYLTIWSVDKADEKLFHINLSNLSNLCAAVS